MFLNRANSPSVLVFALFVVVSFSDQETDTKEVLLSFKAESDRSDSLSSWVNSSDPCFGSWLGVTCDSETRRVTKIVLEDLGLNGSVRALSQLADLRHLSLKNNSLADSSLDLSAWPNLKHLYLSHNRFAGNFPAGVSRLRRLQRLDLSRNGFSGKIPVDELARLPRLLTLRLESNSFNGGLDNLDLNISGSSPISDFNVSRNNLSGEIPEWLGRFNATSFEGNEKLCGNPLPHDCSNPTDHRESGESEKNDRGLSRSVALTIVVCAAVTILAVTTVVALLLCRWRVKRSTRILRDLNRRKGSGSHAGYGGPKGGQDHGTTMVAFEGCKKGIGGVDELLRASAEMLGKGTVGTTYKVVMDGGDLVVVKRVKVGRLGREIDWWLREVLGKLRHSNVVSLRAYHRSQNHDLLLLVYDYLPYGSLHHLLHDYRGPGRTPLDWPTRLKLASDSARGLAFIHDHHNKFKLFHGHLTSTNILVDQLGNACIADVGLPQILRWGVPISPPNSAYIAPELTAHGGNSTSATPRKFTRKCDVYSFGVVLLEIITGKMAAAEGETSLVDWVRGVAREEWTWEVLDVELLRHKEMEEEFVALMQVAMLCLALSPKNRPIMSAVYRMIEDIRTKGVREQSGARSVIDDLTILAAASSPESDH